MIDWRWDFTFEILPRLAVATGYTLLAAGIGYAIALVLGLALVIAQRTPSRPFNRVVRELVELVRSTPLVLQVFFVFYVGPQVGLRLSPWTAGMIAIGVHYACYLSEVYRGAIESVPRGQWEAAKSLNLGPVRTWTGIILPQAVPPAMPGIGNYLVGILKDTPILSVIGVAELMHTANAIGAESYRYLEPFTLVGILFLLISLPAALLMRYIERRVRGRLGVTS